MGMDYPRAWEITRASEIEEHDERCSWRSHRMLCDCHVVYKHPEFLSADFHGAGGVITRKDLSPSGEGEGGAR